MPYQSPLLFLRSDLVHVEAQSGTVLGLKMLNCHNDGETQTKHSDSVYLAIFTSLKQNRTIHKQLSHN